MGKLYTAEYGGYTGLLPDRAVDALGKGACAYCVNIDSGGGFLRRMGGFSRVVPQAFTQSGTVRRLYVWDKGAESRYLIAADGGLYAYKPDTGTWPLLYGFGQDAPAATGFDFLRVMLNGEEKLLIANGVDNISIWDGESDFITRLGTEQSGSDKEVSLLELYYGRLFAAGEAQNPQRLYWSCAPGDGRDITNWGAVAESVNVSGGFADVGADREPITGLFAFSNQLLIFKRDSLYRLLGDRPSNFRIVPVAAEFPQPVHCCSARVGDRLFFLTAQGLYFFDGQTVRRSANGRALRPLLEGADFSASCAASLGERLYFAVRSAAATGSANDLVVEYDIIRDCFLLRGGFELYDLKRCHDRLYLLTGEGALCLLDGSDSYDGAAIQSEWRLPTEALGSMGEEKRLRELNLVLRRGALRLVCRQRGASESVTLALPDAGGGVCCVPLACEGRSVSLSLENVNGGDFEIDGAMQLCFELLRRPI